MPDTRFFASHPPLSLREAAAMVQGELPAGADGMIARSASLKEENLSDAVVYCSDTASLERLGARTFGLVLATEKLAGQITGKGAILIIASPKLGFAKLSVHLHYSLEDEDPSGGEGVEVHPDTDVHESVSLGAGAKIASGVKIGPHCRIGRGVEIAEGARIGSGCTITHAIIGRGAQILPGARIGQAGFGFVESAEGITRVPQLGRVIIGAEVEIGANTTIDRGALDDTVIGDGAKIDNLVQIGHNVRIGRYCIIAAQTGISGSCVIGDGVLMGGQVGLADHLTIGDGAQIAAQAGLMRDVPPGEKWGGRPAKRVKEWLRETAALAKLAKQKNR